jgi:hypothetical protein
VISLDHLERVGSASDDLDVGFVSSDMRSDDSDRRAEVPETMDLSNATDSSDATDPSFARFSCSSSDDDRITVLDQVLISFISIFAQTFSDKLHL